MSTNTTEQRTIAIEKYHGQAAPCPRCVARNYSASMWLIKRSDGSFSLSCDEHREQIREQMARVSIAVATTIDYN